MIRPRIINVPYGLASRYKNHIEINEKLTGQLRKKILRHELSHTSGKYGKKDFKTDFMAKNPHFFEALRFCLKNKEALIGYFPFMWSYYNKTLTFNITSVYPIVLYGLIWSIFCSFLFKISFFLSFLSFINLIIILNILLLIYTHIYVKILRHNRKVHR